MSRLTDLQQDMNVSWRGLQAEWFNVRTNWRDKVAEEFERECWEELETEIPRLLKALDELDQTINQTIMQLE